MSSLSKSVEDAINQQINNELFSSYSYLAMAAYLESEHFIGSAGWMRVQSIEEYTHAMRLYDFLSARGGRIRLKSISEPQGEYESPTAVFEKAYEQEQLVTKQIESLYELAFHEKAFAALVELEWFIQEQVEEEKTSREIVHKLRMVKGDPAALLDLDRELGSRRGAEESSAGE